MRVFLVYSCSNCSNVVKQSLKDSMDLTTNVIKELFNDVNNFLANTLSGETLSKNAEKQKEALLLRLALYLPAPSSPTTPSPYLDMNGAAIGISNEEEYMDVSSSQGYLEEPEWYEDFPELPPHSSQSLPTEDNSQTKLSNMDKVMISVSKLQETAKKYGPLYRKEKILFMDHLIRCWAGITGEIIIMYKSEKDSKPSSVLNVHGYEARPAPFYYPKDTKKRDSCFEIVCPGKKSHQFIARTSKDMEQWIATINASQKYSSIINKQSLEEVVQSTSIHRELPSPPKQPSACSDEYDDVSALIPLNEYDDEDIYHDISEIINDSHNINKEDEIPLPPRWPCPKPTTEDTSDNDSVYDDVGFVNSDNVYYNVPGQNPGTTSIPVTGPWQGERSGIEIKEEVKLENRPVEVCVYDNSEEDIYDDIGGSEKAPETTRIILRQESANSSRRIHDLIKKIESFGSGRENSFSHHVQSDLSHNTSVSIPTSPIEELYECIDSPDESNGVTDLNINIPKRTREVHF